jgi:hypothetical protein
MNIDVFVRPLAEGLLLVVAVVLNVGLSKLATYANSRVPSEHRRTASTLPADPATSEG